MNQQSSYPLGSGLSRLWSIVTDWLLIVVGMAGLLISVADVFLNFEQIPELKEPQAVVLLIVSLLTLAAGIERRTTMEEVKRQLNNIQRSQGEGIERIISSLNGVDVQELHSEEQLYKYVRTRINTSHTVDDLTWGSHLSSHQRTRIEKQVYENYVKGIVSACSKANVSYREVMTFPTVKRLERAEFMLEKNLFGYALKYYDTPSSDMPPLLSFIVIDGQEVVLSYHRGPYLPVEGEIHLVVKHRAIVRFFQEYYAAIWQGAKVIKEGNTINRQILEEFRRRLTPADSGTSGSSNGGDGGNGNGGDGGE